MSESGKATSGVPAGWHPDPAGSGALRWWDGTRWTADLRAIVVPSAQAAAQPTVSVPAARAEPESRPYVPFQAASSSVPLRVTGVSNTRSGWWIAFHPLWGVVTQVIAFALVNSFGVLPAGLLVLVFGALNAAILAVLIGLAFADRRSLLVGGNQSAAAPWWILLTPLGYLIARARQVARWEIGGWTPVVWWIVSAVLAPGVAVLGYFAAIGIVAP